jgi:hypothetical protein
MCVWHVIHDPSTHLAAGSQLTSTGYETHCNLATHIAR